MMRAKICANLEQSMRLFFFSRNVAEEGMGRSYGENNILYVTHSKKYMEICEEREIEMKL